MTHFITRTADGRNVVEHFDLEVGDVMRYDVEGATHHCREGLAVVHDINGDVIAADTYWRGTELDPDVMTRHDLTSAELESATVLFNLGDVERFDGLDSDYERRAPCDRFVVTSQHGLRRECFLRRGAHEDHVTIMRTALNTAVRAQRKADEAARFAEYAKNRMIDVIGTSDAAEIIGACSEPRNVNGMNWCETHGFRLEDGASTCSDFDLAVAFIASAREA